MDCITFWLYLDTLWPCTQSLYFHSLIVTESEPAKKAEELCCDIFFYTYLYYFIVNHLILGYMNFSGILEHEKVIEKFIYPNIR